MSDLISRADAIEAVEGLTKYMEKLVEGAEKFPEAHTKNYKHDMEQQIVGVAHASQVILELPSADAKWIPCSERLPSESGDYLCTIPLDADETYTEVLTFHKGRFYEDDDEWGATYHDDVFAWMPLPKPYKGGDDE